MSGNQMIHVLAIITTKPHQRDAVLEVFNANVPAVHAEAGCIEYGAVVDVDGADPAFGPDTFVVVEKWESLAALKAHSVAPHMKAYAAKTKDLVAGRAVHVLTPV
jgi:quinol monooxygenase YgiN